MAQQHARATCAFHSGTTTALLRAPWFQLRSVAERDVESFLHGCLGDFESRCKPSVAWIEAPWEDLLPSMRACSKWDVSMLCSCAAVCKRWARIMARADSWARIDSKSVLMYPARLQRLCARAAWQITHLTLFGSASKRLRAPSAISVLRRLAPTLQECHLTDPERDFCTLGLLEIFGGPREFAQLTVLAMTEDVQVPVQADTSANPLVTFVSPESDSRIRLLRTRLPRLRSLSLQRRFVRRLGRGPRGCEDDDGDEDDDEEEEELERSLSRIRRHCFTSEALAELTAGLREWSINRVEIGAPDPEFVEDVDDEAGGTHGMVPWTDAGARELFVRHGGALERARLVVPMGATLFGRFGSSFPLDNVLAGAHLPLRRLEMCMPDARSSLYRNRDESIHDGTAMAELLCRLLPACPHLETLRLLVVDSFLPLTNTLAGVEAYTRVCATLRASCIQLRELVIERSSPYRPGGGMSTSSSLELLPPAALEELAGLPRLIAVPLPYAEPLRADATFNNIGKHATWPTKPYMGTLTSHLLRFPNLQMLSLRGSPFFGLCMNRCLAGAITRLEHLVSLDLALSAVRDEHVELLRLRCLRSVCWQGLTSITDRAIVHLCRNSPHVTKLELSACPGLTDRTLRILTFGGLPRLATLAADECAFSAPWARRVLMALWPSEEGNTSPQAMPLAWEGPDGVSAFKAIGPIGLGSSDCAGRVRAPTFCDGARCVWEQRRTRLHICPGLDCRWYRGDEQPPAGKCASCEQPLCWECVLDWEYDTDAGIGGAPAVCEQCWYD